MNIDLSGLFTFIVIAPGIPLAIFVLYNIFFIACYVFLRRGSAGPAPPPKPGRRFALLVPAHNEELVIGKLILSARELNYDAGLFELFIIADNCTDGTAVIASESGARCLVRNVPDLRGKPYALEWALRRIDLDSFDAVAIIDADTVLDREFLNAMDRKLAQGCDAIQGYFNLMNPDDSWLTRLGKFPAVLKFRIRYFCKERLGLTCPLMGNGMCFSRRIMKLYGWNAFSITENWEYYIKLVLKGHDVHYAGDAVVYSYTSTALSHSEAQRKRWFKGRLGVLKAYYRQLFRRSYRARDIKSLDALTELAMPSYSMMLNWNLLLIAVSAGTWIAGLETGGTVVFTLALLSGQASFLLAAALVERPSARTFLSILRLPEFLAWKLYVVTKGLLSMRDKSWEKTRHRAP
ncbi:MAG: glycosyltransferase family 2 protein [Syntrophaceae bacterium]